MGLKINAGGRNSENLSQNKSILFTLIFIILGLIMTGYGYMQYQGQAQSINNAKNITATVTDRNVRTDSSRRGGIDYQAEVTFDYTLEGTSYSSDFIYPLEDDKEFNLESEAEKYLENYPREEEVEAFVNPEEPGKAFLKAERSGQPKLLMIIGGLMMLVGSYKTTKTFI